MSPRDPSTSTILLSPHLVVKVLGDGSHLGHDRGPVFPGLKNALAVGLSKILRVIRDRDPKLLIVKDLGHFVWVIGGDSKSPSQGELLPSKVTIGQGR